MGEHENMSVAKQWLDRLGQNKWVAVLVVISFFIGAVASLIRNSREVINAFESIIKPKQTTSIAQSKALPLIYFDFNRATLRPEGKAKLDELSVWMRDNPDSIIKLEGRATLIGDPALLSDLRGQPWPLSSAVRACLHLSELRNNAVKSYLIDRGIPSSRILTIALGMEQPLIGQGLSLDSGKALVAAEQHNRSVRIIIEQIETQ